MVNFQQEVWSLINKFKVFNIKSIPHTFNTSIDMFKHNVRLVEHSNLRDKIGRTWTYETANEATKSLWWKKQKILLSSNTLVKIEFNKLLVARIIVSVHA